MTYSAVIEYLYGLQKHGIKLGLETMRSLLQALGNPECRLRFLHIGGTNGKGSTAAMVAAIQRRRVRADRGFGLTRPLLTSGRAIGGPGRR